MYLFMNFVVRGMIGKGKTATFDSTSVYYNEIKHKNILNIKRIQNILTCSAYE